MLKQNIKLRQFKKEDEKTVWDLHVTGLKQTNSYQKNSEYDKDIKNITATYLSSGGEFLVATLNNKIIAMGALKKINNTTAEIKRMRVDKKFQGQGIGKIMLDNLIKKAKELKFKRLILDTTVNQKTAQKLYKSKGFKEFGRKILGNIECMFYEKIVKT